MAAGRTLHSLRMRVEMLGTVGGHMWKARDVARDHRHVQETRDIGGIGKGRAGRARHHLLVMVLVLPHILKLVHRSNTFLVKPVHSRHLRLAADHFPLVSSDRRPCSGQQSWKKEKFRFVQRPAAP